MSYILYNIFFFKVYDILNKYIPLVIILSGIYYTSYCLPKHTDAELSRFDHLLTAFGHLQTFTLHIKVRVRRSKFVLLNIDSIFADYKLEKEREVNESIYINKYITCSADRLKFWPLLDFHINLREYICRTDG